MTVDLHRAPLVTRPLILQSLSLAGASIGFYLPLSVVPVFAAQSGSDRLAGLATVALLLATVAAELVTPRLTARIGYRWSLALGLVLLGAPTAALVVSSDAVTILAVSVVRGAGFAICTVAGGALAATTVPEQRRGEGLALIGLVTGVSGMLALPAGVWAAAQWGYPPVFLATALLTMAPLLSVPWLPHRTAPAGPSGHRGVLAGVRDPALSRPAAIFAASTAAVGVFVTFLPLAAAAQPAWVITLALLAQAAAATATRWVAGRIGDVHGPARLLAPGLLLAVAGLAGLAVIGSPAAVVCGSLVFGAGCGVLQNATLALMYSSVPAGRALTVSAIWNTAYDLGMAGGALVAGLVAGSIGYPLTFVLTAAAMLPALVVSRRATSASGTPYRSARHSRDRTG
ncbi:MFS transporter [Actinoplanes sp. NPDC024001]|uniref:MFS transporter n=1 Tax=Actinoplanes sp. NPDC024001 TaxID=3154598 RepID=UPI0034054F19